MGRGALDAGDLGHGDRCPMEGNEVTPPRPMSTSRNRSPTTSRMPGTRTFGLRSRSVGATASLVYLDPQASVVVLEGAMTADSPQAAVGRCCDAV